MILSLDNLYSQIGLKKQGEILIFQGILNTLFKLILYLRTINYIKVGYFTRNKTLSYLKVAELKRILSKHNLSTSGKKGELVTRISQNINIDRLDIPFKFQLTKETKILFQNMPTISKHTMIKI